MDILRFFTRVPMFFTLACLLGGSAVYPATWSAVDRDFRGCTHRLERCERLYERFAGDIRDAAGSKGDIPSSRLERLRSREDHLARRIDRLKRMSAKIASDISAGQTSSNGCPSCIVSSVELFCRQIESVASEIRDEQRAMYSLSQWADENTANPTGTDVANPDSVSIDSLIRETRRLCLEAGDSTARMLLEKGIEKQMHAAILRKKGELDKAKREQAIAEQFILQAHDIVLEER